MLFIFIWKFTLGNRSNVIDKPIYTKKKFAFFIFYGIIHIRLYTIGDFMLKQFLEVGKIVGTHGLNGEVRVECWCDGPEFLCYFKNLYYKEGAEKIQIKGRPHKNIALVKIKGVDTIEQADMLRGTVLYINRDDIQFEDGINFVQDLLGCDIKDVDTGVSYGKLTDVLYTGANDVYEVTNSDGKKYYIPVIDDVVINKDVENEVIEIKPMKGLFDNED